MIELLQDNGISQTKQTMLKCDNESCIVMTKHSRYNGKIKHT